MLQEAEVWRATGDERLPIGVTPVHVMLPYPGHALKSFSRALLAHMRHVRNLRAICGVVRVNDVWNLHSYSPHVQPQKIWGNSPHEHPRSEIGQRETVSPTSGESARPSSSSIQVRSASPLYSDSSPLTL